MGPIFVVLFLAVFALAIGQALVRRKLNPFEAAPYTVLPDIVRTEIERVLPGFVPREARVTKKRDEIHVEGSYQGERVRVEADFDDEGRLVEFDVESARGFRSRGLASLGDVPAAARREIDRVLGGNLAQLEKSNVLKGTSEGEACFEVNGFGGEWKWEISVTASGQLREMEREMRRSRR